jgi:hypothetical protein
VDDLFGSTFILNPIFIVLVGNLHEDCGEDLGSWTHVKGRFTLWSSKSRGHGIEWGNFVESPKRNGLKSTNKI